MARREGGAARTPRLQEWAPAFPPPLQAFDRIPDMPIATEFPFVERPVQGRFVERLNRFACLVEVGDEPTKVFLPNSGRLEELLRPEAQVMLERRRESGKTRHDLLLIQTPSYPGGAPIWAALDSRLPPKLLAWAIEQDFLETFAGCKLESFEPPVPAGRLDLLLDCGGSTHYVETKSVNLVDRSGTARFPDAPTSRGRRHVDELRRLRAEGAQASVVFIVVREDAHSFAPFVERDSKFAAALRRAKEQGVTVLAAQFQAGTTFHFEGTLPVDLRPPPFPGFWPERSEEASADHPAPGANIQ